MARNDATEREMEDRLREHFAEEARDLQAPDDLWERIEGRLGEQSPPPRFVLLRGGGARLWAPAAAAALALAAGIAAWAIIGGADNSGGDGVPASTVASIQASPDDEDGSMASATEAAESTPSHAAAAQTQGSYSTASPAAEPGADAGEAAARQGDTTAAAAPEAATAGDAAAGPDPQADSDFVYGKMGGGAGESPDQQLPPDAPADTTFEDYGRTPFVDASEDAVSTFSLDTDRTSYYLALRWAREGYRVEPDSVRAEEWVNSFEYRYDRPQSDDTFAVASDLARHPLDGDRHIARITFQAPDIRSDAPLNVTLVLDSSGSMSLGNRVAIARAAAEAIRSSLREQDRIAVVQFTDYILTEYTVEHTVPGDNAVGRSIRYLLPQGSTNVQAGIDLGVQLADAARRERPEAINYVILMSDGVANVDATNPFAILDSAADTDSGNPLRLITIGVGIENYNDFLLEQLAQHGNGWYRYLDSEAQARETFSRENWLAISTPFADQTRAQVRWNPDVVKAWRIVGYENRITPDETFEQDRKEFAEIPSGAATTVFYELILDEARVQDGSAPSLGEVALRWVSPASGESRETTHELAAPADAAFDTADRGLRFGAIVGLAADRYSALGGDELEAAAIATDLARLLEAFEPLRMPAAGEPLGTLPWAPQAHHDFGFLLRHLLDWAAQEAGSSESGYSP